MILLIIMIVLIVKLIINVTVGTVLNKGLVIARLGSGARLLVAGVALWLSAPPELRQGLAFSLVRQLHAGAA